MTWTVHKLQYWQLVLLICYYSICASIAIVGEALVIFYILQHAPKERPLNKMILIDQVCIKGQLISEWFCKVNVSPKIQTKNCHVILTKNIFSLVCGIWPEFVSGFNCIFVISNGDINKWTIWRNTFLDCIYNLCLS